MSNQTLVKKLHGTLRNLLEVRLLCFSLFLLRSLSRDPIFFPRRRRTKRSAPVCNDRPFPENACSIFGVTLRKGNFFGLLFFFLSDPFPCVCMGISLKRVARTPACTQTADTEKHIHR